MHRNGRLLSGTFSIGFSSWFAACLGTLFALAAATSSAADFSVEYELIARSGTTTVPGTSGTFNGFGVAPAIDEDGNVVFTGGGGGRAGVYTALGYCCQIVADTQTAIPGGGGATFYDFSGSERHDIDGGRVAFQALVSPYQSALFSNVGQASPTTLRRIATEDGVAWSELGDPWVDGNTVAVYGMRPSQDYEIVQWDGASQGTDILDPGAGFNTAYNSQASISGDAAVFLRYSSNAYQMVVRMGNSYEPLATADVTPMPGMNDTFRNFYHHPVVDRAGMDVAFMGYGNFQGLFKRIDGGALQHVADNSMPVPGSNYEWISLIDKTAIGLANGQVVFQASTTYLEQGIYTDIGGELATLLDTGSNDTIVVDGQSLRVAALSLGTRGFAYGPDGYMVVFRANLATGGTAIIRAVITDGTGGGVDGTFTVRKDYSDNNTDQVSVTASCTSGTITSNPLWAREGVPAVFQITGAAAGTTCTAVETSVASGYTKNESDCQNGDPLNGSCTLVNTLIPPSSHTFTVYKDFSDNNSASVGVTLSCTSGTVTNNPQSAREGVPAVFQISGASTGATCTAVESSVPSGYTKNETDCQNGDPLNGSCTLVNTLIPPASNTFTVIKDFSDNNTSWVSVAVTCTSGTVTNSPQWAREGTPAVFSISGASPGATCTAVESSVPSGYTKNETDCQNGDPLNGSCTLVNTLIPPSTTAELTVYKDFSDGNSAWVQFRLTCTSGTVTNSPRWGREGTPAVFTIEGASAGATCTAEELKWPDGYNKNESDCQNVPLNGSCTIVNTLGGTTSNGQFTVYKDFSDNSSSSVSVSLSCTGGTVTNNPQWASEAAPAVFDITGASAGTTCTAVENSVPSGYTKNETGCQDGDPLNGSCTIVNTKNAPTTHSFTVRKDFSDANPASVSVSLTCTSGTVTNSPQLASEGSSAVFTISGASAGATCTAVENVVPSGYTANQSDCQNGDPLNGSCTIVNTLNAPDPDDIISTSGFESGQAEGWTLSGGARIDTSKAIGVYSLMLENGGSSAQRSVSTAGYSNVSVTMHIAAESLEKNDICYAELSTNGGGSWSPVATLETGNGSFSSATVSPAAASNNANLRLRYRLVGKGKGDYCWGDDIVVRGQPMGGGAPGAVAAETASLDVVLSASGTGVGDAAPELNAYASRGFDPGFDHLTGDGAVERRTLGFEELAGSRRLPEVVAWSGFSVPAGAAQPEHAFEGSLRLQGVAGSNLGAVPEFHVEFVQVGNHLLPQSRVWPTAEDSGWAYLVDTGRVWQEAGDRGYSRAALPLMLVEEATGCLREGAVTFLFDDRGAGSSAAMRLSDSPCGAGTTGLLEAIYTPASVGNGALEIQQVLGCAAETWLPAVQGHGGMTVLLLPDDSLHYVLSDAGKDLWLDAGADSGEINRLCD